MKITGEEYTGGVRFKARDAKDITRIVVHCSATAPTADIGAATIDQWHRGNGWWCIGYHFVIRRDGTIERGRPPAMKGAHAPEANADSIGICLVGGVDAKQKAEDNFTPMQKAALFELVGFLKETYPITDVLGHRDLGAKKDCPSFDVRRWFRSQTSGA